MIVALAAWAAAVSAWGAPAAAVAPHSVSAVAVPRAAVVDDDSVAAARSGLVNFLAANPPADPPEDPARAGDLPECPLVALDDLQAAVDDLGFTEPLLDFRARPLASVLAAIAPDLPGAGCTADVDGDSRDAEYGLYANVSVVDLGSDTLVLDYYAAVGRDRIAVVAAPELPGGKLYRSCSLDEELHACMAFWNDRGFLVAVNLWSNPLEITEEEVVQLLVTLYPQVITMLAGFDSAASPPDTVAAPTTVAPTAPSTTVPGAPAFDVDGARRGLARLLALPPLPMGAPPGPCALATVSEVDGANELAGIDAKVVDWAAQAGADVGVTWATAGVACSGRHLAADGTIELEVTLLVADAGTPEEAAALIDELARGAVHEPITSSRVGGTVGRCTDGQLYHRCLEFWEADGIVIGLSITDAVYTDRNAMHAVLSRLVPAVVGNLSAGGSDIADPLAAISGDDVDAAALAIEAFVAAGVSTLTTCPVLSPDELEPGISAAGLAVDLATWGAETSTAEGTRLTCRTHGQAIRVDLVAFAEALDAADFVASVALADGGSASDLVPGDLTVGSCTTVQRQRYCTEWWYQDRLAIGVTLLGGTNAIGANDAATVLVDVVPTLLTNASRLDPESDLDPAG